MGRLNVQCPNLKELYTFYETSFTYRVSSSIYNLYCRVKEGKYDHLTLFMINDDIFLIVDRD